MRPGPIPFAYRRIATKSPDEEQYYIGDWYQEQKDRAHPIGNRHGAILVLLLELLQLI